jgi:uncharacterized protein (DUF2237 family)
MHLVHGVPSSFEGVRNILGTQLKVCCDEPNKVAGYYRNGSCDTGQEDVGTHVACAIVDEPFLQYTKSRDNDLTTPFPPVFHGLQVGDKWCLCIARWIEAHEAGKAPRIIAESTHEAALQYIGKDILMKYDAD